MNKDLENEKRLAAVEAVRSVEDGMIIGLGTGSTANIAIREIGKLVAEGFRVTGVATSNATEELALSLEIPLKQLDDVDSIDLTIDGTDEFDADLNLIKGGGGALFREKMVARLSKREIIMADSTKRVEKLGAFRVPVEVVPIALVFAQKQIEKFGGKAELRLKNGETFVTDARNRILDADFGLIEDVRKISAALDSIEGVVCHGLFIDLADVVIMASGSKTETFEKPRV
ncbi:MAG: ribose-5-phosphate isomerase RpiA [Pyrinomonadaceae bacterium]|nr:ribose-5-phosphate isomerase RpiA [Pyrinomonadaceae bacterium]